MNIQNMLNDLNDYFEYIKAIYLNEYNSYLNEDIKKEINELKDVIVINEDLEFKIKVDQKITLNLNKEKYIKNNMLKESDLSELDDNSERYINYICNASISEIIKKEFLLQVIKRIINNQDDVLAIGTAHIIASYFSEKYKMPYLAIIPSKEEQIAKSIMKIVGNDLFYKAVLNRDYNILEEKYDEYTSFKEFEEFKNSINKLYRNYRNKIGKVYLIDSLYEYNKLEYEQEKNTKLASEQKTNLCEQKLKRLSSIKKSLLDIDKHKILFTPYEQAEIETFILQINKIITKLVESKNEIENIEKVYNKIATIEESSKKLLEKIWLNSLTNVYYFQENSNFEFVVVEDINKEPIEATYITNNMIKDYKNFKLSYGYLIKLKENGIAYITTEPINYQEREDNSDVVVINDKKYYIKMNDTSYLKTPKMLEQDATLKGKITNTIILNRKNIMIEGVYCFIDDDLENNHNYIKASALAEEHGLPLIKLNMETYVNS